MLIVIFSLATTLAKALRVGQQALPLFSIMECHRSSVRCFAGMSWDFWKVSGAELAHPRPGGVPPLVLWVIRLLNLVFNFLNLFWFSKMLKGAIKVRANPVLGALQAGWIPASPDQSLRMQAAGMTSIGKGACHRSLEFRRKIYEAQM